MNKTNVNSLRLFFIIILSLFHINSLANEPEIPNEQPKSYSPSEFVAILKASANINDSNAMLYLAEFYEEGENVEQSYSESLKWYKKSAKHNNPKAMYRLGKLYMHGDSNFSIKKDKRQALKLISNSANKHYVLAQHTLCSNYFTGELVNQNFNKSFYWCQKAAEQGYSSSQNNIAFLYRRGLGVQKSDKKALFWLKKSALQGFSGAQASLGDLYETGGIGVKKNYQKSLYWNSKAAEQGSKIGFFNMGHLYENGHGVTLNKTTAKNWYIKSCKAGDSEACQIAKNLELEGF